jgi:TRAP-type C4-dicarboxylate transport system substrate-binding protein
MGATKFADLVREKTGGKINIKPYFGSALLKGAQLEIRPDGGQGRHRLRLWNPPSTFRRSSRKPTSFTCPSLSTTFENLDKMKTGQSGQAVFAAMEKVGPQTAGLGEKTASAR